MPEVNRTRNGSLAFWPRKKASREYPVIDKYPELDECKPLAFPGYKAGMTQVQMKDMKSNSPTQNEIISVPVTVLDVPPVFVIGARGYRKRNNELKAVEDIGASEEDVPRVLRQRVDIPSNDEFENDDFDEVRLIAATQPTRSGLGKKNPEMFELPLGGDIEDKIEYVTENIGSEIDVEDVFEQGEYSDAIGVTKGKGFAGVVERYDVKILNRKDEKRRTIGSIGARGVGRVLYSVPQPGQEGFHRRTDECKHVLKMGESDEINPSDGFLNYGEVKEKYVAVKGSVPGPKKRMVFLRKSFKKRDKTPVDVYEIDTDSQQGM